MCSAKYTYSIDISHDVFVNNILSQLCPQCIICISGTSRIFRKYVELYWIKLVAYLCADNGRTFFQRLLEHFATKSSFCDEQHPRDERYFAIYLRILFEFIHGKNICTSIQPRLIPCNVQCLSSDYQEHMIHYVSTSFYTTILTLFDRNFTRYNIHFMTTNFTPTELSKHMFEHAFKSDDFSLSVVLFGVIEHLLYRYAFMKRINFGHEILLRGIFILSKKAKSLTIYTQELNILLTRVCGKASFCNIVRLFIENNVTECYLCRDSVDSHWTLQNTCISKYYIHLAHD